MYNLVQNTDILQHVLTFLVDDGTSLVRFAMSSKELYDRVIRHETFDPNLWKDLIYHRWNRNRLRPKIECSSSGGDDHAEDSSAMPMSYRDIYIEKRRADAEAIRQLEQMVSVLQKVLNLDEQQILSPGNPHIGQAWDHHCWGFLLRNRADCFDVMKATARRYVGNSMLSVYDRLKGFLAARCVQNFHFADCLLEWKRLTETSNEGQQPQTKASQLRAAYSLERHALLVCEIQKTPLELLQDDAFNHNVNNSHPETRLEADDASTTISRATKTLDEIARVCRNRICDELEGNASVTAKLAIVSDILVTKYGFSGNDKDYYNYHNVLLDHVLESKTGMPLTLCVIYCCICRRLGIAVQVTGLPGHIVLGYDTNDEATDTRKFIDVFHGCRILSTDQCRRIVASYGIGWRADFLAPLSTKMTLQRIFNNLQNCHEKAMRKSKPSLFGSDLTFQQHILGTVHRCPSDIACTLLERLTQELSILLSTDLLCAYHLLPEGGRGIDPVINATHARVLLELSSYVGLSYHNYA